LGISSDGDAAIVYHLLTNPHATTMRPSLILALMFGKAQAFIEPPLGSCNYAESCTAGGIEGSCTAIRFDEVK
jgi:hypothetical protein